MVKGLHGRDNLALHCQKGYRLSLVKMVTNMNGQDGYRHACQDGYRHAWPRWLQTCMARLALTEMHAYRLARPKWLQTCMAIGQDGYRHAWPRWLQTCMAKMVTDMHAKMVTDKHGQDGYRLAWQGLHWPRCMLTDLQGQDSYRLVRLRLLKACMAKII